MKKHLILILGILFLIIFTGMNLRAAEQFVGIGGGIDVTAIQDSAFDFTWGYELKDGQYLATTMRMNGKFSEFTEDFIQEIVEIEPLKLTLAGIGSVGATSGEGITKFDFGGGIGGFQDLSMFTDKLKNCGIFIGAKFMRNNFNVEERSGGLSRIIFEFVYRFGGD